MKTSDAKAIPTYCAGTPDERRDGRAIFFACGAEAIFRAFNAKKE